MDARKPFSPRARRLLPMLLAWPAVIALGGVLNWASRSPAPMATLPMIWLLAMGFMLERSPAGDRGPMRVRERDGFDDLGGE